MNKKETYIVNLTYIFSLIRLKNKYLIVKQQILRIPPSKVVKQKIYFNNQYGSISFMSNFFRLLNIYLLHKIQSLIHINIISITSIT